MHSVSNIENSFHHDLVDEKGSHQDILKFASRADIVVCCLAMNSETVTDPPPLYLKCYFSGYFCTYLLHVINLRQEL